ncbi:MAG: type II toxin-antitoxin system prevent-host-death family antitoxin [Ilumatobacteraceae bacterium]|jgi:prevent-host-death family protein|nr:type II toxin-antitoxin system prevent-host-death family antitoxin [Ilumatobacteraceae bacterium]
MTLKYFTSTEAKTRFGEFIEAGMKSGVCLTRNGRAAGYLVPADEYEKSEARAPASTAANGVEEILTQYSLGKVPRSSAMQQLGISDYGLLLRLLNAAGLPYPTPKEKDRRKLDQAFDAFMDQAQSPNLPA